MPKFPYYASHPATNYHFPTSFTHPYTIHSIRPNQPNPFQDGVVRYYLPPRSTGLMVAHDHPIVQASLKARNYSHRGTRSHEGEQQQQQQQQHHPPPPLIPLSAYQKKSPPTTPPDRPAVSVAQRRPSPDKFVQGDRIWMSFEFRDVRVDMPVYKDLTETKRKIIHQAHPSLAQTNPDEIGLYLVHPSCHASTTSNFNSSSSSSSSPQHPKNAETIPLDDDRWKTLLRHCKREKYVPLIFVITGTDLDRFYQARGRTVGRVRMGRGVGPRWIPRVESTGGSSSYPPVEPRVVSPILTPLVPIVQTVHSTAQQPPVEVSMDGDLPTPAVKEYGGRPLLTKQPLTDDRFDTPDEALTALREIAILVGQGLSSPLGVAGAHVDSPTMDAVVDTEQPTQVRPPSPVGNMIVEIDEDASVTETKDENTMLRAQQQLPMSIIDEEIPFSTIETEGFLDEIQPSEVVSVEDIDLSEVTDEPLQIQPVSCADTVGEVSEVLDTVEHEVPASIVEDKVTIDIKEDAVDPPKDDLVTVQILAVDQLSAIPMPNSDIDKKDTRLWKRLKKVTKPKPLTALPIIDRTTHKSARGMTINERRLHESLRARFDGRGIAS